MQRCHVIRFALGVLGLWASVAAGARAADLTRAVVVVRPGERGPSETMAATILVQEIDRRTGISPSIQTRWPAGIAYDGLDPRATYTVRLTGQGQSPIRADGVRLKPSLDAKEIGAFREYAVPAKLTADGELTLTWDPVDESHLNWRRHSHVAEVWLLER
jgi:hypothetical protein